MSVVEQVERGSVAGAVPHLGQRVAGPRGAGWWLGSTSDGEGLLFDGVVLQRVPVDGGWCPVPGAAPLSVADAAAAAREGLRSVDREREKNRQEMNALVSDAHEWADRNSLCEEFDRFMHQHGLPQRRREREVEVRVSFVVTKEVDALDEWADDLRSSEFVCGLESAVALEVEGHVSSFQVDEVEEI